VVLALPWLAWWKLADRKVLVEVSCYGLLIIVISVLLDGLGVEMTLWGYPYKLFPLLERLFHADFTVLPITFMLIYQYFPKWKMFIGMCIIIAIIFAFVAEPFSVWLDIYEPYQWKSVYSFPIYVAMPVFCKWLLSIIVAVQNRSYVGK